MAITTKSPAEEFGFEGAPEKPNKIVVTNHPRKCNCRMCSMDYCDCSEEGQGSVAAQPEYWQKK